MKRSSTGGVVRATCFLSGRVQGVGMRYAIRQVAQDFPVTGTVENLDDGRVKMVVEGLPSDIAALEARVRVVAPGRIDRWERYDCEASHEFVNFSIHR